MAWPRTCREVSELVSQRLERSLTLRERAAVRVHLLLCEGCRNFVRQIGFIRRALRRWRDEPPR